MGNKIPYIPSRFQGISLALEFCAWVIALLAFALRYVNGPAVTKDQAMHQIATAGLSLIAALALRVYNRKLARSG